MNELKRKFWDSEDVVEWVRANVPESTAPYGSENAAIWWCAYIQAEAIREDATTKDLAEMLIDGLGPINHNSVGELIQSYSDKQGNEPSDDNAKEIDAEIEDSLRKFFVIK